MIICTITDKNIPNYTSCAFGDNESLAWANLLNTLGVEESNAEEEQVMPEHCRFFETKELKVTVKTVTTWSSERLYHEDDT